MPLHILEIKEEEGRDSEMWPMEKHMPNSFDPPQDGALFLGEKDL